jgi:hypothetical protein
MKKLFIGLVFIINICLLFTLPSYAGITGKIRGIVKDSETGEALPGANIVINKIWDEGIESDFDQGLGAATSITGEYIILKVSPGTYSVTASMMGFTSFTKQHVRVSVDRTFELNFLLKETVLDAGEEIVVQATRDLVQMDVSATENYISSEEYKSTPFANRIEDVISLQSGISGNIIEGEIKIREGSTHEVGFLMDGVSMYDQKYNRPVMSIQPGVVQEIKIMRNGFNAEYGQSRSGMINVITKNPSDRLNFSIDYQFDPAQKRHYGRDKYDTNWNLWRLYTGPQSFNADTLVTPDGLYDRERTWIGWNEYSDLLLNDNNPDNDLTPQEALDLWKWRHRPVEYGDKASHNIDVSLSGRVPLIPWKANFLLGSKYENHAFSYPQSRDSYDEKLTSLKIINTLNKDTKITVSGLYSDITSASQQNVANGFWDDTPVRLSYAGGNFPNYYLYDKSIVDQNTFTAGLKLVQTLSPTRYYELNMNYFNVNLDLNPPDQARPEDGRYFHDRLYFDPQSGWIPKENGVDDEVSGYRMYGKSIAWENSWNKRYTLNGFVTDQFHPAHELKLGFDLNFNRLFEDHERWPNEDSTQVSNRKFDVSPFDIGLYVQDKIEFKGMIANVGVRFDYLNTNTDRPDVRTLLDYDNDQHLYDTYISGNLPSFRAEAKYYVSPRVGISHPITDRGKIYFNYGHFIQTPPSFNLYVEHATASVTKLFQLGNPEMEFEKTIAYELGGDFSLNDFFQLHVGAFYKDNSDILGTLTYLHLDQSLWTDWYGNYKFEEIRGFEIELRKSVGQYISGWINYNYIKKSKASYRIPHLGADPLVTKAFDRGDNGWIWGVPRSNIDLIQPNARGVVTFSAPPGFGPRLNNFSFLGDTQLSFKVFYAGGGQSEHPKTSFRDEHPDVRFHELDRYWTDMRLSKRIRLKSLSFEMYMDMSNVFHTKYRNLPGGTSKEDYYDDLWESGRLDQVGTDELSNPKILRTENDDVYRAKLKYYVFGLRINL